LLERVGEQALSVLGDEELHAPWLLWSEVPAALRAMAFRQEISHSLAKTALVWRRTHQLGFVITPAELQHARDYPAEP
jgi:hypothetical protein